MAFFQKLKDKAKSFLYGSNKFGSFVDNVTKKVTKVQDVVSKATASEPRIIKLGGKDVAINNSFADPGNFMLSSGAIGKQAGRLLKQAIDSGASKETLKNILKISERKLSPLSKLKEKADILKEPSKGLQKFIQKSESLMTEAANKRNTLINDYVSRIGNVVDPEKIVKIRKAGNGAIKITRGELETMKAMGDLKPSLSDNFFQNPIRIFEKLGEPAKELFYRPIKVAESLAIKSKNYWNKEFKTATKGLKQTSSERIMTHALSLEDDGAKILKDKNITAPLLNDKENKAYEFMRARYDNLLEGLNNARAVVGKEPINKRKNYFTHIKDLSVLDELGFNPVTDDIESLLANKVHRNSTAFQFAKKRSGALTELETDAFNVFSKYQEKALDHINLTPAIGKVRELARTMIPDGENKFRLMEKSPNAFKYITEWTDYVAGQKVQTHVPKIVENVMNKLNQNVAFATLSYNVRSALIQPSAIINSITEINPKNTLVGIKDLLAGKGKFALDNSNVLEGRQFETAIQDIAKGAFGKAGRVKTQIAEAGIKPLQFLDSLTAQATWLGAYNKAVNVLKMEGKKAFNYADDIVTKTQASAARSDVAKIQRSTGGKVLTQFQTFVINDFNRIMTDILGIGVKDVSKTEVVRKAATYLVGVSLWNHLSEDVLGLPSPFPRPIKALKEEGAGEALREVGSQIPIVGGSLRYGSGLGGAVVDLIQNVSAKVNGKYTPQSWWEITGKLLGIPGTNQLKKTLKSIKGLEDGYTVTTNEGKRVKIKITDPIDKVRSLLLGLYDSTTAKKARDGKYVRPKPQLKRPSANNRPPINPINK
jgi:hypothetical protein